MAARRVPAEVWVGVAWAAALPLALSYYLGRLTADVYVVGPDGAVVPPQPGDPFANALTVLLIGAWYACLVGVVRGSKAARYLVLAVLVLALPAGALSLVGLLALCTREAVRHTRPRGRRTGMRAVSFG